MRVGETKEEKKGFLDSLGDSFMSALNFLGKTVGDIVGASVNIITSAAGTVAKTPETLLRTIMGVLSGRSLKKIYTGMGYKGFVDDEKKNAQLEAAYKNMELLLDQVKKQNLEMYKATIDYIDKRLSEMQAKGMVSPTDPVFLALKEEIEREKAEAAKAKPVWFWPVVIGVPAAAIVAALLMRK